MIIKLVHHQQYRQQRSEDYGKTASNAERILFSTLCSVKLVFQRDHSTQIRTEYTTSDSTWNKQHKTEKPTKDEGN